MGIIIKQVSIQTNQLKKKDETINPEKVQVKKNKSKV